GRRAFLVDGDTESPPANGVGYEVGSRGGPAGGARPGRKNTVEAGRQAREGPGGQLLPSRGIFGEGEGNIVSEARAGECRPARRLRVTGETAVVQGLHGTGQGLRGDGAADLSGTAQNAVISKDHAPRE